MTQKRALLVIVVIWLYSILQALFVFMGWREKGEPDNKDNCMLPYTKEYNILRSFFLDLPQCCQKQSIDQTRWLSPPSGNLLKKKKGCISRMSKLLRRLPPSCWRFSSVGSLTVISSSSKPFQGKSRFLAKFTCRCCGWATLIQRLIPFCTPSATIVLSSSISHNTKARESSKQYKA